jgi:hypothetical protein
MSEARLTGGCQCGAVRYALSDMPEDASICHCRMCQKAFGSYFAPLAGVRSEAFKLTRGELGIFRSSDVVERGFCRDCGTPLTFQYVGRPKISVSLGSLDNPAAVKPVEADGVEGRMPWFSELDELPGCTTEESDDAPMVERIRRTNHQHPDHDTANWPASGAAS